MRLNVRGRKIAIAEWMLMLNRLALLVYLDPEFTQSVGVVPEEALSGEIAPGCCLFTNNITCTVRNFNFDLIEVVFFFWH